MHSKPVLTHAETSRILDAAVAEAGRNEWAVSIAVVDDGSHLLAFLRTDGATPISVPIAIEKARTAALGRCESKAYEDIINGGRTAFLSVPLVTSLEGGVPVIVEGQVVGAVGVSGVKSDQDAQIAKAGARSIDR